MIDRVKLGALAVTLALCSTAAAHAAVPSSLMKTADFTIAVPVVLHDLDPRIDRFRVVCVITDANNKTLQQADAKYAITGTVTKLNGLHEFSGTVAYAANLALPAQRPLAAGYVCEMRLLTTTDYDGAGNLPVPCSPADLTGLQSYKCIKAGTPVRPQVSGTLPASP